MNKPTITPTTPASDATASAPGHHPEKPLGRSQLSGRELYVEGLCKSFGAVQVLDHVSFEVHSGEFVTLLGPSGCGKTTLLRILAGLEVPDRGRVRLGSTDLTLWPANRRPINTVFQNYALFPHLNVFENVAFGLRARRREPGEIRQRVLDALAMLQLDGYEKRAVQTLSGGQKQRVALARALVNEPDVLLLDEPMSALDAKLRAEVQIELRRLQRRLGRTFVLVTHDQNEAMTVSDRLLVMRTGQIVQTGSPTEVYDHPVDRFVAEFLGLANLIPAWHEEGRLCSAFGVLVPARPPGWEKGTLAIRPERIRLHSEPPGQNGIRATVAEVIHQGTHLDLFTEPHVLRVRASTETGVRRGDPVWLELPEKYLEVLRD